MLLNIYHEYRKIYAHIPRGICIHVYNEYIEEDVHTCIITTLVISLELNCFARHCTPVDGPLRTLLVFAPKEFVTLRGLAVRLTSPGARQQIEVELCQIAVSFVADPRWRQL